MADTYTGTDWVEHTKITTDIMKTIDEGVEANKEAASNAQTAAENAQSSADNAQTAADNAGTAADNANAAVESEKEDRESADNDLSDKIQANSDLVSDTFDTSKEYSAGDYCIYDNVLYKFTADKESGDWDSSKVEATTAAEEIKNNAESIKENTDLIDSLNSKKVFTQYEFSATSSVVEQFDALGTNVFVVGHVSSYNREEADMPDTSSYYVIGIAQTSANYKKLIAIPENADTTIYFRTKSGGSWASSWVS